MTSASGARSRSRLPRFVTGVPFLVTAGVLAVLALAYTLAGFFLVPRLITTHVPRYVQEQPSSATVTSSGRRSSPSSRRSRPRRSGALGALFGGEAEGLDTIAFEPGRDTVLPPERQKLRRVAEVLGKRPRLKLTVHGGYETGVDGEALRSLRVRQDLARKLEVTLKAGEDPGPIALDQAKTQRALEALLAERAGDAP